MNTQNLIARTTITFVALALAGIFMTVGAKTMIALTIFIPVGHAVDAIGIRCFLIGTL